jgi:hypothetical protein
MILKSCSGHRIAINTTSLARHVKGDDPDKNVSLGHPGRGLGVGLTSSPRENIFVTKLQPKPRNEKKNGVEDSG